RLLSSLLVCWPAPRTARPTSTSPESALPTGMPAVTGDGATGELVQAQGWVLIPLCRRPSGASPRQWDRKEAAQIRSTESGRESPSGLHPHRDASDLVCASKRGAQRFGWSEGILWAWLDLNQGPLP